MADVFFSYAREDHGRVEPMVERLRSAGYSVWWDRVLEPGEDWADVIDTQLGRAGCVVVAFSERSLSSHWVRIEAHYARGKRILIPVRLEDVQVPDEFRGMQFLDCRDSGSEAEVERLVRAVGAVTARRRVRGRMLLAGAAALMVALAAVLLTSVLPASRDDPFAGPLFSMPEDAAVEAGPDARSIAVLPFRATGAGEEPTRLAEGITVELIDQLSRQPGLRVVSRSASFSLPPDASPASIRERLQVAWIVEGRLDVRDGEVTVNSQLVDTATGFNERGWDYQATLVGMDAVQRGLVTDIVRALPGSAPVELRLAAGAEREVDGEAYRRYLLGQSTMRSADRSSAALMMAETQFGQATELDPEFGAAWGGLCKVHLTRYEARLDTADLERARAACDQAVALAEDDPEVLLVEARLDQHLGELEEAEGELRRLLEQNPYHAEARMQLGDILAMQQQIDAAEAAYQRAISDQPGYWSTHNGYGMFLFRQGRTDDAARQFVLAMDLAPSDPTLLANLGGTLLLADDLPSAIEALERSADMAENAQAMINLGTAYYYSHRFQDAVEAYRRATALSPRDYRAWASLGDAYALVGDVRAASAYQEARDLVGERVEANPQDAAALVSLASFRAALGEQDEVDAQVRRAVEMDPESWEVHYYAAFALDRIGARERAKTHLERAMALGFPATMARRDPLVGDLVAKS